MIYKYTDSRAKLLRVIMSKVVKSNPKALVFAYGAKNFRFQTKTKIIEVSLYTQEIVIRPS